MMIAIEWMAGGKGVRDEAMFEMARKIRARAILRGGELLEREKREKGGRPEKTGAPMGLVWSSGQSAKMLQDSA